MQYETIAPSPIIRAKQTGNSFAGLTPGDYVFKVTDANGCYDTKSVTIKPVVKIAINPSITNHVNCFGNSTGNAVFTISGFTGTYSYTINGGTAVTAQTSGVVNLTNQPAGIYNIAVTDNVTGCTENSSVTIQQPAAALTASYITVNANCNVGTSKVTVTALGGTQSYKYSFVQDGAGIGTLTTSNIANLDPTVNTAWDAYVVDANGCQVKLDVTIAKDNTPTVSATAVNQCLGVGTYTITAIGVGKAPLTYSINGPTSGFDIPNTFAVTASGTYNVWVKDANGCVAMTTVPVIVNDKLTISAQLTKDNTCSGTTNAVITLNASGGSGSYTYTYTSTPVAAGTFAGNVFTTSAAADFIFTVTDTKNCTATTTVAVKTTVPVNPDITGVTQTQFINCNGEKTAAISIALDNTKGLSPFVFNVRKISPTVVDYGTQTSGLEAGTYTITVTDAKGCTDTFPIVITQPNPIVIAHHAVPITCGAGGVSKGAVIIDSVIGGTGPYNYYVTGINGYNEEELNNLGTTSVTFNVVDFGLYQIRVVDSKGCTQVVSNVLVASPPNNLDIDIALTSNCLPIVGPPAIPAGGSAVVSIGTALTGAGPFHFNIYRGSVPPQVWTADGLNGWQGESSVGSKTTTFVGLTPGVRYTFIVYDEVTKCYYYQISDDVVPTNSTLSINPPTAENVTCTGAADGKVTFTVGNTYVTPISVSYEVFNAFTNLTTGVTGTRLNVTGNFTISNLGPLPKGSYYVLVKETAGPNVGCSVASANFNILESPQMLVLTATVSKKANCAVDSGIITATASFGTAPYLYQLLPSASPAPTSATAGWSAPNTFNANAGNYVVYVKDAYNCIKPFPITLTKYTDPTITAPASICYTGVPFTFTIGGSVDGTIVGGASYSVDGSAFQTSPSFTFNTPKIYNLVVKDGNGCTATTTFEVKPQLLLDVKLTRELSCIAGSTDAQFTLTPKDGYGTYTYSYTLNGGATTPTGSVLTTSAIGTYIFTVRDAQNCKATYTIKLDPIPAIAFTPTATNLSCFASADGTINVDVTAGVGPYEYQLERGATMVTAFQPLNKFTGLIAANNYVVTVRDAKKCILTAPVTITQPAILAATSSITTALLCTAGNAPSQAVVTIVPTGGTTPYLYSYDLGVNYITDDTYKTTVGKTFDVYVKDKNGCTFTLTNGVNVPALVPPTDLAIVTSVADTCLADATVEITAHVGGTGILQYEILSPIVRVKQTSTTFANLAPGTYVFQITDANGCTYSESHTVVPVTNITVSAAVIANVSCNGGSNGSLKFTVANNTGAFTAVLTAGTGTLSTTGNVVTASGLVAGNYTLEVTDTATGCTNTASIAVTEPTALALALASNVNANCDFGAKVSVTASGGTAPYEYSFVQASAAGPGTFTASNEAELNPATTTSWKVYVRDANNCVIGTPLAIPIERDVDPTITAPALICFTGTPVTVTVTATADPDVLPAATYSVNGGAFQASRDFTISAPGTYVFRIKDGNGCIASVSYEVKPQLTLQANLIQDLTCALVADITLVPGGGTGTYTKYEVYDGTTYTVIPGPSYKPTVDGTYSFRVTDSQNCEAVSNVITVSPKTVPTATFTQVDVSCFGGNNGSFVLTPADGIAPYTYSVNGAAFVTGNTFSNLTQGVYNVIVKDAKQCVSTVPITITITEPSALSATSSITTALVCTAGNAPSQAVVTVVGAGGTTPYEYSFDGTNYSSDNTFETFAGVTMTVYVKDKNGCTFTLTNGVNVPALVPPTDLAIVTSVADTCLADATVEITAHVGGTGILQYEILSPIVRVKQTSTTFANLAPDTYVFQITDGNGCTYSESHTVVPVTNITVSGSLVKNVSCNGGADGSIKFTVENKAGGYSATLNPNVGTLTQVGDVVTITNLPAGPYTLNVVDAITGCVNSADVKVEQPAALGLSVVSKTAANCYFGAIVTVKAVGGSPVYKYAFVASGTTPIASDYSTDDTAILDPATANWDVYVMDANLICTAMITVPITKDDTPTINVNANVYCYTGGPVPITITGTTDGDIVAPPMYSIGNGYYPSPNFTLNAPGSYEFFIKDGNGCVAKATYVLRQELLIDATLTQDLNCTTSTATIALTASQGTGAGTYSFEYDLNNSGTFNAVTALPFVTSTPGTYTFRVKDAQCSTISVPVVVTPKTTPRFTVATVDARCKGDSNGSIEVTATDGVAPYQYSITDGATTSPLQASNLFTGLKAGTYTINVVDSKNCPATSAPVTIIEPIVLTVTHVISPFGCDPSNTAKDAVLTLTAHDGTGPYSYSFDNGVTFGTSPSHTMNTASTVSYVIVDINGCRATGSANVPAYNPPTHFDLSATPIYCNNVAGTATVTVSNITGGEAGYTYAIIEPVASATSNTVGSFANLLPGTYVIKVTDANGCSTLNSIDVKKANEVSVDAQLLSDVACNGGTTGSIAFTVSNYITPANYTFALSPNNGTFTKTGDVVTYTGLTAANYTFTVTDNTSGCTDNVANFLVNQPAAALNFAMSATNITCNEKNATITVTATGGTPAYSYAAVVSGAAAPTTFSTDNKIVVDTNNGTRLAWDVYVKDFNGCTTLVKTQNILTDALPSAITANVTSQCPSATGTYEIVVSATGKAPLQYSIGTGFQSSPSFQVNSSGSYDVTVKDGNGCTVTVTAAVVIDGALDLQLDIQALPSCDAPDGRIVAKATGGSGNYRYSSGAYVPVTGATATFNNVSAGSHTVTVTDLTTGCTDVVTVELSEATKITGLALDKTDVTCNGGSNGRIIVNLAPNAPGVNDNPIYRYTLTGTAIGNVPVSVGPQDSNVFDNLLPGDYTVRVTSGRGCNAQVDTRIAQPLPIVVNAPAITPFGCTTGTNTTSFASITVNSVTGGTNPYVLYVFSKNGTVVQSSASNVYNETDLAGGSYSVKVFDSKGCEGSSTAPIVIAPFITMNDINVAVVTPITCINNETIQVSVATTGGTPTALVYTLTGTNGTVFNQTNPTGLFSGLAIGNYAITVFNPTTGCTIKDFHYIFDPNTFAIEVAPVKGEVCYGDADGSVDLTFVDNQLNPTNDAGPFTYTITGPVPSSGSSATAGPVRISGLRAGQYSVTAKLVNNPECTVTNVFTINQPTAPLLVTKSQSAITCITGNNDGVISASATGGWGTNYQYELVGPVNVAYSDKYEFTGLTAGNYTINVKDEKGCIASTTAQLVVPTPIVVTATANASTLSCFGDKNGIITVAQPTGGQGSNYMYTLNIVSATPVIVSGPQAGRVFTGLSAGTYTITVTDGFGCTATSANVVISEPTEVKPTLDVSRTQTCLTLSQITLGATGGTAPYTYSTSANFATVIGSFASSVSFDVPVGKYQYYVKDANGCVGFISNEIKIDPLVPLSLDLDVTNAVVKCQGESTGVIVAEAVGGLGSYSYTLLNAAGTAILPAQAEGRFENLAVGTYRVKVDSGDCTFTSAIITISEPATAVTAQFNVTNVACFGENNGKLEIIASGGTGIIKYALSPDLNQFDTVTIFEKLAPGDYQVIVQDENGCFILHDFTITQPELLIAKEVPNSMIPEVCVGDKDGAFSVEIKGGTAPYSVSLDIEKGPFTQGAVGQTIFDFTNLTGGTHVVYYKDAAGCINSVQINMPLPVVLNPTAEVTYDCVNNTQANMVTITVDESITNLADVDYQLDGTGAYQPSNIFTNLAPGNHYVTARHTNGCEVPTVSFEIKAYTPLGIKLSDGQPEMNVISVTGTGGAPAYEYSFNGEPFTSSNTFKIYKSGDYEVIVRDQNGCTATIIVPMVYIDVCLDNYFTPNGDGVYDTWGPGCTNIYNNLEFSIFDRYGRVIAKYHYGQKWDGRYNSEDLPSGDYWYVLKLNDEKDAREFVGHFTLYR
ncbi:hypothetical protein D3C86_675670 [compost metagenome]